MATGLLLIGVGRATRLLRFLGDLAKTYEGTLRSAILRRGRFWDIRMYAMLRSEWLANDE